MGTPEFALPALGAILEAGHNIMAVYTASPRPAHRGQKETLSPVHQFALSKNLPVYTPATLKNAETQTQFKNHNADAAIVAAYGLLLPQAILDGTKMGCINIHPSLLPRWRGAAPIQRTIMAGDKETGVVIMQMNAGLDTGDMLAVQHFTIPDGTSSGGLHDTLAKISASLLVSTLEDLQKGKIIPIAQPAEGITYAHKITKTESRIDWNETADSIRQKILGLNPSPCAYFMYQGETIKILDAQLAPPSTLKPGTVTDNQLTIACGKNSIRTVKLQRPGKKPMMSAEFLHGYPIPSGTVLE